MNRFMKRTMIAGTAAMLLGASLGMSTTAFAKENTSITSVEEDTVKMSFGDGILKVMVPKDENWKEIKNEEDCITITDGANIIYFNHFSDPADLPKVASYDAEHEMSYEVSFSKKDVSITLVGKIAHTEDYASVKKIIDNIEIDIEKLEEHAKDKHELDKDQFLINNVNYTAWVTAEDGLCLRAEGTASGEYIKTEPYGAEVTVIGEILKNGVDTGWRKVTDKNGVTGYCSGQFLSLKEIAAKKEEAKKDISNYPKTVAIYCAGDLRYVYLCSNGQYSDNDGHLYNASDNFKAFVSDDGITYHEAYSVGIDVENWFATENAQEENVPAEEAPVEEVEEAADEFFGPESLDIYCAGDLRHVTYYGDGKYIDEEGNLYTALASCTTFVRDSDGVTYYTAEAAGIDASEWEN